MFKNYLLFCISILPLAFLNAQIQPAGIKVIDNKFKLDINNTGGSSRSIQKPKSCDTDTSEYPRYKASTLVTISVSKGRALGQLYSSPKPLTLTGFTFYAFVLPSMKTAKKMPLYCNVYKAGLDSLPTGPPLRSDTLMIDSTLGGGLLSIIEKHATWAAITIDSNYIITVETDDTLTAGVVTNNYANGDGERENLNCGSISGLWYNGKNLNVGGNPFDCDVLLHPHVKYNFGTDFSIKSNCYGINDSVKFTNAASGNMSGSKMYNRYLIYGLGYFCHRWDLGNFSGTQYTVDNKVKYAAKANYTVRLISTIFGYTGNMLFNGCEDTTEKLILFKPDVPTFSGLVNLCIGDTAKFTAVSADTGVVFEWLLKPNTTPFFFGKTYIKYPVTKNDTFYLRANNKGCLSGLRTVIIKANSYPTSLQVLNDSVCSGSRANLGATSNVGNIQWFTLPLGGLPFFTGPVYQTNILNTDTQFYVQANNNGCILSPRVAVKALVGSNFAPLPPSISNDTTVCYNPGNSVTVFAVTGAGLSIRWFDQASGGTSIGNGNMYSFMPIKREVKILYADAFNGVCGSTRVPVVITIEQAPTLSNKTGDVICNGDSAHISCTLPFGEADWYDASTGGNLVYTGEQFALFPSSSTSYFIETRSDVCLSPSRTKVDVTVNNYPTIVKLWGDTICAKNPANLKSVLSGNGTLEWFEDDTSSVILASGKTFTTPVLNGSKKYYVRPVYAGCIGPRTSVQPLVKPAPFSGFSFEVMTWQQVKVSPINAAGCSVKWEFGDGAVGSNNTVIHRYSVPGTYNIKLVLTSLLTGCKDSTIIPVLIEQSSIFSPFVKGNLLIYPNPSNSIIYLDADQVQDGLDVIIFDMKGMECMNIKLKEDNLNEGLNIEKLAPGIYFIRIEGYYPFRLVKQ